MQIHPRSDDKGNPVKISNPSKPTLLANFDDPSKIASVVPDGETPESLNGIAFSYWTGAPTSTVEWLRVPGQADFNELPMIRKHGKKLSAGVVIIESDGRIWVVAPTNVFGGYKVTFPKGTVESDMTPQASAIREAFEESGLQVELIDFIGDFERSTSISRYYLAKRVGGNPADCGWESQSVGLIPQNRFFEVVSHSNDKPIIEKVQAMLAAKEQ